MMALVGRIAAFGAFFKRYARTWHHAVATAALTAFGMLTFVNGIFAVVALLAYVLPPLILYARSSRLVEGATAPNADRPNGMTAGDGTRAHGDGSTGWSPSPWEVSVVPTEETLTDVAVDGDHAYAVGTAGTVLRDAGDGWEAVVVDGPAAQSSALTNVDTTGSGAVWFAGDSGVIGRIDASADRHVSHAEPADDTTNIVALAAAGTDAGEAVLLADGSGRLRRGQYIHGEMAWDKPTTPGSGSSFGGVVLPTASVGYAYDTNQSVFRITDGGRTSKRIGVDAPGSLTGLAAADSEGCLVCDDSGAVTRYDDQQWTPERIADTSLESIAIRDGQCLATAPDGAVFERDRREWTRVATPAAVMLSAVTLGDTRAIAVGADGTIIERDSVEGSRHQAHRS